MENKGQTQANAQRREAVFSSIRRSLAASRPYDESWQKHHVLSSRSPRGLGAAVKEISRDQLIENFRESLAAVSARCYIVGNEAEAATMVFEVIQKISPRRIAHSGSALVKNLLPNDAGFEFFEYIETSELFESDLGITSAQWAIAETGTLVLEADRERHRLTSLVPPVHLCILKAENIRQTLGEILELISRDRSRLVTFITGSSRTSDIELTLAVGVHGPEELHVIIIAD